MAKMKPMPKLPMKPKSSGLFGARKPDALMPRATKGLSSARAALKQKGNC